MVLYLYGTSGNQYVRDVYGPGEIHHSYRDEKSGAFSDSPSRAFGMLDNNRRAKLLHVVLDRYGNEAKRQLR